MAMGRKRMSAPSQENELPSAGTLAIRPNKAKHCSVIFGRQRARLVEFGGCAGNLALCPLEKEFLLRKHWGAGTFL